jgi:hypothetical protein
MLSSEHLVWNDEFSGEKLNQDKWVAWVDEKRHDATNLLDLAKVSGGKLSISPITSEKVHHSSMVCTDSKFDMLYGRVEIRVKLSTESGAWSNFWLYTHEMLKDKGSEIDLFEHRAAYESTDLSGIVAHSLHYNGYGSNHLCNGKDAKISSKDWNVISLTRTKDYNLFTVNGVETWKTYEAVNDERLFFVLSVEIADKFWAGDIPKGGYSGKPMLEVDYIRVFSLPSLAK